MSKEPDNGENMSPSSISIPGLGEIEATVSANMFAGLDRIR